MAYKNKISGVYIITCLINEKYYIGYSNNIQQRLKDHLKTLRRNIHDNIYLQNSWNKYGEENFTFEVLEEYSNENFILSSMEHYWCNLLQAHNPNYGYNIKPTHPFGQVIHSEHTRKRLSEAHKGKKVSVETREKMSKSKKGIKASKETRDKLSKLKKGKKKNLSPEGKEAISKSNKDKFSKQVVLLDLDGNFVREFQSIRDCAKFIGVSEGNVSSMTVHKKQYRVKNYIVILKSEYNPDSIYKYTSPFAKIVIQYDLEGNLIREWKSIAEAARFINGGQAHIVACCKEKRKTHKNFIWKYKE